MHTLVSWMGAIGHFAKGTGAEDIIAAAFGCLNGKCWTNAFRAFRMLFEAPLHDFLSDGEKSYNDIVVYLERAWSHPTGKMWVDTIIYPTFLAMELVRAERC